MNGLLRGLTRHLILGAALLALAGFAAPAKEKDKGDDDGRAWLGVYLNPEASGERGGIKIISVIGDGPAQKAGIRDGDVIVSFNGVAIEDDDDFFREFRGLGPNASVPVVVLRDDEEEEITVVLGDRPEGTLLGPHREMIRRMIRVPETRQRGYLGVHLQGLTNDLREYFEVPEDEGVLISQVEKDSPAAAAGLKAGDVITEADGDAIGDPGDLIEALHGKKKGDEVDLTFYRDGRRDSVTVVVDEAENRVFDVSTLLWCDEDDENCNALGAKQFNFQFDCDEGDKDCKPIGPGKFKYQFDQEAFRESMENLQKHLQSEDFQKSIGDQQRYYQALERDLERKMQELERKLEEMEKRLQEIREKEETSRRGSPGSIPRRAAA